MQRYSSGGHCLEIRKYSKTNQTLRSELSGNDVLRRHENDENLRRIFCLIGEAYEVLVDHKLRAIYDQYGEEGLKRCPWPPSLDSPLEPYVYQETLSVPHGGGQLFEERSHVLFTCRQALHILSNLRTGFYWRTILNRDWLKLSPCVSRFRDFQASNLEAHRDSWIQVERVSEHYILKPSGPKVFSTKHMVIFALGR
ncbi:hypothetical protein EVAR_102165_1 [Eumeta japonica]|uniref:J domain-containing protein n=1 Tax=Eumeta variegata TaxID=151549 RepID=A0A4C1SGW0_EUMVA|nr:hypothetical protein EVAR_102165_1 [Eumeta japonica]